MILMIPVRMAVLGVLNIKLRSNKGYGVIIYFHDLADKILSYESKKFPEVFSLATIIDAVCDQNLVTLVFL